MHYGKTGSSFILHLLTASTMYITNCRIFLNCTVKNPHLIELAKLERGGGGESPLLIAQIFCSVNIYLD